MAIGTSTPPIIRVMFLPGSQLYEYIADFDVAVGDLVAVPPSWVSTEGTVAVVKEIVQVPAYKGELKTAWRVIPRSQWHLHDYTP
jgi:hypothetical protein